MGVTESWGLSLDELNDILSHRPSMRGMLMGFVAEYRISKLYFSDARIHKWTRYDDHDRKRRGDFWFTYHGREFALEVKSLQSNSVRKIADDQYTGTVQVDASDSKPILLPNGDTLKTACLVVGGFEILAVNLFEFGQKWRFAFAKNSDLPRSTYKKYTADQRKHLLATSIKVTWPLEAPFRDEPFSILDELAAEKPESKKK